MRSPLLALFISLLAFTGKAQQSKYTAFTVRDGLPSNNIYRCVEDNKGFLWVATDAGIARFDGKRFQVFTTRDGLPDNEVLSVIKEANGRIWVNCFRQSPAYFDEIKNKFINPKIDSTLARMKETTGLMIAFALKGGGVMYCNGIGVFIFRDGKMITHYRSPHGESFLVKENNDGTLLKWGGLLVDPKLRISYLKFYHLKGDQYIDSVFLRETQPGYTINALNDGKLYSLYQRENRCLIYSDIKCNPIRFKTDSIQLPESILFFDCTDDNLNFYAKSGKVYCFDKKTLKPTAVLSGDYAPNSLYTDSKGNMWVGTIDKGLILYRKQRFKEIKMPGSFTHTNFFSIARKPDGTLLAGNYYGEVVEVNGDKFAVNKILKKNKDIFRQRKILLSHDKIFTFSEAGNYANYSRELKAPLSSIFYAKTAITYSDSIIIAGNVGILQKLNTITEKVTRLHPINKRVTALTKAMNGLVYYGSTDGLYKYDLIRDTAWSLTNNDPLLAERVMALCTTDDSLIWVATANNGVIALKNDKVIFHITTNDGIINNSSRSITAGRPGQVWLGTTEGISVINYKLQGGRIIYAIQNLSVNDGLAHNVVNEMLYQADTIYAATGDGISALPANIGIPKFNILVQLIGVKVDQRDTILANYYKLNYDQQNIQMHFAGIELSGHFKLLQYTLDNNKDWINLDENTLTIQLNNGYHTVQVRAVDVNGNISNKILTLNFDIATPFWKAIWFWVALAIITQVFIIYMINTRQKRRKEAKLANQIAGVQTAALEQQAFTSLMNPHFMFNALNSIQHYMNMQDRQNTNRYLSDFASLIRKNFEAAQQSFIPLEQEIENIKIYLRLEQMRFNGRFSNQIVIDEHLETDDWMIPTMILQPLIENALLHGIMPSAIAGEIIIDLKEQEGNLVIKITDNGIGIANSMALKVGTHKSRGMELIKKRVAALSSFGAQPITIAMLPAFADEKNPGNQIILFIPRELHQAWVKAQR
jgi:ligand-binding sensor domain-containing protein/anti-sigma regulatory factor (Ser/Thr protein kinase)